MYVWYVVQPSPTRHYMYRTAVRILFLKRNVVWKPHEETFLRMCEHHVQGVFAESAE